MKSNQTGYIYILTNESFHKSNWIKIGYTTDINKRVKELSNTSVPKPYEVYATYEIPRSAGIADKALHSLIQKLNPNLRLTANREFFEIEPWDAYDVLESMAIIHDRQDKLYKNKKNIFFNDPETNVLKGEYSIESLFPKQTYIYSLYEKVENLIKEFYPEVNIVPTKNYVSFKKGKKHNIVTIWPKENNLEIVLNAKLGTLVDKNDMIYDISNRLWTHAQYALRFDENTDIKKVEDLISQTYKLLK